MIVQSDILSRQPNLIHGSGIVAHKPLLFTFGEADAVVRNREILMKEFGVSLDDCVFMEQVHGTNVAVAGEDRRGHGARDEDGEVPSVDGIVTNTPRIFLVVKTADCVPIFLYDSKTQALGMAHAGWRGTIQETVLRTIQRMENVFGTDPQDIFAYCGPAIGSRCYSIDHDLQRIKRFRDRFGEDVLSIHNEELHLDLKRSNRFLLEEAGVNPDHIEISDICTHCDEQLPSHRRQKHDRETGILSIMGIRE